MRQTPTRPPFEREHLRPRRANLDGGAHFFPIQGPFAKKKIHFAHIWMVQRLKDHNKAERGFPSLLPVRPPVCLSVMSRAD